MFQEAEEQKDSGLVSKFIPSCKAYMGWQMKEAFAVVEIRGSAPFHHDVVGKLMGQNRFRSLISNLFSSNSIGFYMLSSKTLITKDNNAGTRNGEGEKEGIYVLRFLNIGKKQHSMQCTKVIYFGNKHPNNKW